MTLWRVLNTIERALARQRLAVRAQHWGQLPGQHRKDRIFPQFVVIVEVPRIRLRRPKGRLS
jgi:hypothetical protein